MSISVENYVTWKHIRLRNRNMGQILQVTIMFCSLAGIMKSEASSIVVASSSSQEGSSCNGYVCPPNTNCMASSRNDGNGNSTTEKSCTTHDGAIVKQEIVTVGNGTICVKNMTMDHKYANKVNNSCRKMSKEEKKKFHSLNLQAQHSMSNAFMRNQEAMENLMGKQQEDMERFEENMSEKKLRNEERLYYAQNILDLRKQQLENVLEDRQATLEGYFDNMELQSEARNSQLEFQQEAKMFQMERARELLERRAEMLEKQRDLQEQRMERALQATKLLRSGRSVKKTR